MRARLVQRGLRRTKQVPGRLLRARPAGLFGAVAGGMRRLLRATVLGAAGVLAVVALVVSGACSRVAPEGRTDAAVASSQSAPGAAEPASAIGPGAHQLPATLATGSLPASSTAEAAGAVPGPKGAPAASGAVRAGLAGGASRAAAALAAGPPRPPDGKGAGLDGSVDASRDGEWLLRLVTAPIVEVTPNRGGASVSMRVRFADGSKAALKPEQAHVTDPRAEIAAYHVDRIVGFGRTAAVAGRRIDAAELRAALVSGGAPDAFVARFDRELVVRDGQIGAALIAWHTAALVEEEAEPPWAAALAEDGPAPEGDAVKLGERSDLVVFDFLIDNPDRFSGGNILRLGKGGPLVFLDQGAAFGKNRLALGRTTRDRLEKVCRFRPATLAALRRMGAAGGERLSALLAKSLERDALAPVLNAAQLAGVDERLGALLAHAQGCAVGSVRRALERAEQADEVAAPR